jgi:Protein of unknown function (DUF4019)
MKTRKAAAAGAIFSAMAAVVSLPGLDAAQADHMPQAAEIAAQSWLSLVDAGKYGDSWVQAAQFFKSKVGRSEWAEMLGTVRGPLGRVNSRKLSTIQKATDLPGAPKGHYLVLHYATSFANLPSAIETVVPMQEKDGAWRVSGYFVKKN